jgi:hypothetical protein
MIVFRNLLDVFVHTGNNKSIISKLNYLLFCNDDDKVYDDDDDDDDNNNINNNNNNKVSCMERNLQIVFSIFGIKSPFKICSYQKRNLFRGWEHEVH